MPPTGLVHSIEPPSHVTVSRATYEPAPPPKVTVASVLGSPHHHRRLGGSAVGVGSGEGVLLGLALGGIEVRKVGEGDLEAATTSFSKALPCAQRSCG